MRLQQVKISEYFLLFVVAILSSSSVHVSGNSTRRDFCKQYVENARNVALELVSTRFYHSVVFIVPERFECTGCSVKLLRNVMGAIDHKVFPKTTHFKEAIVLLASNYVQWRKQVSEYLEQRWFPALYVVRDSPHELSEEALATSMSSTFVPLMKQLYFWSDGRLVEFYHVSSGRAITRSLKSRQGSVWFRRRDLQGSVLRAALRFNWTSHPESVANSDIWSLSLWSIIQDKLNFSLAPLRASRDGYRRENGSWTGNFKLLADGNADVAVGFVNVLQQNRYEVMDFTNSLFITPFRAATRLVLVDYSWRSSLKAFSTKLWIAVLGTSVVLVLCLWITGRSQGMSMGDSALLVARCIFCRGMGMEVRSLALRVCSLVALLYGHLVCTTHSFGLLAHLTASWSEPQVSSLEDALQKRLPVHLLKYSTPALSRDENSLMAYERLLARAIASGGADVEFYFSSSEGLEAACRKGGVYIDVPYMLERNSSCSHHILRPQYYVSHVAMVVRKNLPELPIINHYIMKLRESGILSYLTTLYIEPPRFDADFLQKELEVIELHHVEYIFLLYMFLVAFSITLLLLEISLHRVLGGTRVRQKRRYEKYGMLSRVNANVLKTKRKNRYFYL